jgi:hypothetical protein
MNHRTSCAVEETSINAKWPSVIAHEQCLTLSNLGASQALHKSQCKYHNKIDHGTKISERHLQNPLAADTRLPTSVFARAYVYCYCFLLLLRIRVLLSISIEIFIIFIRYYVLKVLVVVIGGGVVDGTGG